MKKSLIAAGVVAALMSSTAAGAAAGVNHVGHLNGVPGSAVKFKEAVGPDASTVTKFTVRNFELACDDGMLGAIRVSKLSGAIPVSASGAFKANDDNGQTVFRVNGQINRNKAFGTFRYSGLVEGTDGVTRTCNSGKLAWVTRP